MSIGLGTLPSGVGRSQIVGIAAVAGIGFAAVARLAFDDPS